MRSRTARRPCPEVCHARCSYIHRSRALRWTRRASGSSRDLHWHRRPAALPPPTAGGRGCWDSAACRGTDTRRSSSRPSSGEERSPTPSRTRRSQRLAGSDSSVVLSSGRRSRVPSYALNVSLVASRSPSALDMASAASISTTFANTNSAHTSYRARYCCGKLSVCPPVCL